MTTRSHAVPPNIVLLLTGAQGAPAADHGVRRAGHMQYSPEPI
jgi:hypothetical protein